MRSYPVNENPIGSADSAILRYRQTDILLLYYKNIELCDCVQIEFEDMLVVQCVKYCYLETKHRVSNLLGRDVTDDEKSLKSYLTHKIDSYFD